MLGPLNQKTYAPLITPMATPHIKTLIYSVNMMIIYLVWWLCKIVMYRQTDQWLNRVNLPSADSPEYKILTMSSFWACSCFSHGCPSVLTQYILPSAMEFSTVSNLRVACPGINGAERNGEHFVLNQNTTCTRKLYALIRWHDFAHIRPSKMSLQALEIAMLMVVLIDTTPVH